MEACSQIIVKKSIHNGVAGGKLIIDNCTITGCDKWQGIIVEGKGNSYNNTQIYHGSLQVTGGGGLEISDAFKGVYAENGGKVDLDGISAGGIKFENNENDITMMNYTQDYSPTLQNMDFKGKWLHNDYYSICGGSPSGYATVNSLSTNKKMIYLEGVKEFNIHDCSFTGNQFFNGASDLIVNAIEMYSDHDVNVDNVSFGGVLGSGIYGYNLLNTVFVNPPHTGYTFHYNYIFNNYYFDGVFDRGIYFESSSNITLGYFTTTSVNQNSFLGQFDYATFLTGCTNTIQFGNIFNTPTFASPSSAGGIFTSFAVYYENGTYSNLQNCVFQSIDYPAEIKEIYPAEIQENNFLYSDFGLQVYAHNTADLISIYKNRFVNDNYGLIISPDANPIGATTNSFYSQMQTNIECNFFKNNNYAIVGCGSMMDQGINTISNGNKWDHNYYWDWLWDVSYDFRLTPFTYYFDNYIFLTNQVLNEPNASGFLSKPNTNINGVYPAFADFTANGQNNISIGTCFSALMKTGQSNGIKEKATFEESVINNPVNNELILRGADLKSSYITCYDALGKSYNLSLNSSSESTYRFNTQGLAAGIYFITVNNQNLKFIKL